MYAGTIEKEVSLISANGQTPPHQFELFNDHGGKILPESAYEIFAKSLRESNCKKCALAQSRTHIVVDRGNPIAKIMVIGEAPGQNEDLQGKAFIGRAGKLFDQIMESVGILTNEHCLICNVAKCRPPKNRPPRPEEAQTCIPFLLRQIELVQPQIILLLGATALRYMDPVKKNFSMEEETGRFFHLDRFPGISFMVLYHPAALLYNSNLKPKMLEHIQKLKKFIDSRQAAVSSRPI